jgi:Zn-dependent metalloprotease
VDPDDDAGALARILASGDRIGLAGEDAVRQRDEVLVDERGERHARFERFHAGLYVFGGDFVVHSREECDRDGFSATLREPLALTLAATLSAAEAEATGLAAFPGAEGAAPRSALAIDALDRPALVYDVLVEGERLDGTPSLFHALVDARTGEVRRSFDEVPTWISPAFRARRPSPPPPPPPPPGPAAPTAAIGTGRSLYAGLVPLHTTQVGAGAFVLLDGSPLRTGATIDLLGGTGGGTLLGDADNVWGDFTSGDRASAGVDAHFGARVTHEYLLNVHGRRGVAGDGRTPQSSVHYGRGVANAFYSDQSFCVFYGDGDGARSHPFVSIDMAAHEITHGLTARTANLVYGGESGALNEATSDIFGACVEHYAANPARPGNYLLGERLLSTPPGYYRSMSDPASDGASIDHASLFRPGMDVHHSSGVPNHFFYLLSEGGTHRTSGVTVAGITRAKAERIWFRALTVYMTSGTDFAGARAATLRAASDLFGAGSPEQAAAASAWTAVGVN